MHRGQQRLRYLDGLRGVAISLVILWHLYGPNEAAYLPYGSRYAMLPVVRHGWMGVELFFLISGFVIFMTIERCAGVVDFLLRRWVRLFPAMLVASIVLFAIDRIVRLPGPGESVHAVDLLPGLLFLSPSVLHLFLRVPVTQVDGVFWTIYVEAAFYVVFSVLYFRFGWRQAVAVLVALFLYTRLMRLGLPLVHAPPMLGRLVDPFEWFGCQFFGWFAAGALFYRWVTDSRRLYLVLAIVIGLAAGLLFDFPVRMAPDIRILFVVILLLFAVAHRMPALQRLLELSPILFVGDISYPLYLVHDNLGIALSGWYARRLPTLPPVLAGLLAILSVALLAWAIARFAEPWLTPPLRRLTDRVRARVGIRRT